ncbi:MAG TPA: hypothetical protein VK174_04335 [Chitinophagales bacterium]|nr:hypothetical protein [Chitinophagales bacterium]
MKRTIYSLLFAMASLSYLVYCFVLNIIPPGHKVPYPDFAGMCASILLALAAGTFGIGLIRVAGGIALIGLLFASNKILENLLIISHIPDQYFNAGIVFIATSTFCFVLLVCLALIALITSAPKTGLAPGVAIQLASTLPAISIILLCLLWIALASRTYILW